MLFGYFQHQNHQKYQNYYPRCWLELASLRVGWPGSRSCPGSVLTTFYTLPRSDPNDYFVFHKCAKWWHYQNGRQWSWSNPNEGEQVSKEQTRCCWCGREPKTPAQEVNQGGFMTIGNHNWTGRVHLPITSEPYLYEDQDEHYPPRPRPRLDPGLGLGGV